MRGRVKDSLATLFRHGRASSVMLLSRFCFVPGGRFDELCEQPVKLPFRRR